MDALVDRNLPPSPFQRHLDARTLCKRNIFLSLVPGDGGVLRPGTHKSHRTFQLQQSANSASPGQLQSEACLSSGMPDSPRAVVDGRNQKTCSEL